MAYVTITLRYHGDEYLVEVDDSLTPKEFLNICKEELTLNAEFSLVAISSFTLTNGSIWELIEVSPKNKVKKFEKK